MSIDTDHSSTSSTRGREFAPCNKWGHRHNFPDIISAELVSPPGRTYVLPLFLIYLAIFDDFCLNLYRTDFHQICRVGRTILSLCHFTCRSTGNHAAVALTYPDPNPNFPNCRLN